MFTTDIKVTKGKNEEDTQDGIQEDDVKKEDVNEDKDEENCDDYLADSTETNFDDNSEYLSLEFTAEDLNFYQEMILMQCFGI